MDDTMSEEEKKKKKGMAIVIAVTPHAPKKPEDTMKPDKKMEKSWPMKKAWAVLKNVEHILDDEKEGRDFGRQIAGKPTQGDYQDLLSRILQGYDSDIHGDDEQSYLADDPMFSGREAGPTKPSEIPVEDPMDDVREEEEREEKLAEGVDPEEYELGSLREKEPHPSKYDEEPTNPFKR
jgi:hypothetical protein